MKIVRIELWHVSVPLPAPFLPSWIPGFRQTENRFDLIRLGTESGLEGWSAAPAMGREREGLGALLGPYLLGERADDIPNVRQRIREMSYLGWRCGWIEPACWDLLGKAAGKPVYELLGGAPGRVRLYASSGQIGAPADRARYVGERLAEGFDALKMRVHAETLDEDVALIRAAREAAGAGVVLGVDANQGWRVAAVGDAPLWDFDRALAFCRAAEALGYAWVEEPLAMDAYDDLARLRGELELDLSGGELNNQGLPELGVMIDKRCYDVYQPDAVFCGGIAETWAVIDRVAAAGARYSPHTWTNGIGFAINLNLMGASLFRDSGRLEYPYEPPGWIPEARDGLLREPWRHQKGWLDLPALPGLGFEIDRRALARWGSRFFKATPARVAIRTVRDRGLKEARHLGEVRGARLEARHAVLDTEIERHGGPVQLALAGRR